MSTDVSMKRESGSGRVSSILAVAMMAIVLCIMVSGCGSEEPYRKAVSPVTGVVTVDGKEPGAEIQVVVHPAGQPDTTHPTISQTVTTPDGKFSISTYAANDGVPAGDYVLTFSWQEFNLISRNYGGPDKLNGRYSDKGKSTFKITVEDGKPLDMGTIALTTK